MRLYAQAIDVLESQVARLGGSSDLRAAYRAKHADYYSAYSDLLLTQKQPELAFQVLERSRARTLLETLAESHVNIRQGAEGASRVVASLWKVDDVATADMMGRFYRGMLQEGLRPAAALRQAQIEMQEQKRWTDPYYWAAFTIQGEWK